MRTAFASVLAAWLVLCGVAARAAEPSEKGVGPALRLLDKDSAVLPGDHADGLAP